MDWQSEFSLAPELCYLNHAAVAPWPQRTHDAVTAFAKENTHWGASHYAKWLETEHLLRKQLQQLINAPDASDIALVKNTSEGLSMIAYGLDWHEGNNLVITNQEFPSNKIVWQSLQDKGVEVRYADISGIDPEQAVIRLCDENTRLVSLSSVQYGTGLKLQLDTIGKHCRGNDILYCIDAIQSIGAVQFDAQDCHADFVVADGHKWMLGPEGLALFYSRKEVRDQLKVLEYGWHMVEHAGDFDRQDWSIARSAQRFECGSPNLLASHALSASLSLLLDIGMDAVEKMLDEKIAYLLSRLSDMPGMTILSAQAPERRAGIVTFQYDRIPDAKLYAQLRSHQVICAQRGGGIRFSPHFYTPIATLDRALSCISRVQ